MNAIILAAGLGSRFGNVTKKIHKALLPVNNIPNLENTVKYLIEAGIKDIYIVIGYLSEQFSYLQDKYHCKLIYNDNYLKYNNIYSFYCALDFFGDSYVIDSDVTLFTNIFVNKPINSSYFLIKRPVSNKSEWIPIIEDDSIKDIIVSNSNDYSLLGISYWTIEDSTIIKNHLGYFLQEELLLDKNLYWDNIPMQLISELNLGYKKLDLKEAYEIDCIEEYNFVINSIGK